MKIRHEKVKNQICELTANFLKIENPGNSLVTVTNCDMKPNLRQAIIFISVIPEKKEDEALIFYQEKLGELRKYLSKKTRIRFLPNITIELDRGEKNRQRIEELLKQG